MVVSCALVLAATSFPASYRFELLPLGFAPVSLSSNGRVVGTLNNRLAIWDGTVRVSVPLIGGFVPRSGNRRDLVAGLLVDENEFIAYPTVAYPQLRLLPNKFWGWVADVHDSGTMVGYTFDSAGADTDVWEMSVSYWRSPLVRVDLGGVEDPQPNVRYPVAIGGVRGDCIVGINGRQATLWSQEGNNWTPSPLPPPEGWPEIQPTSLSIAPQGTWIAVRGLDPEGEPRLYLVDPSGRPIAIPPGPNFLFERSVNSWGLTAGWRGTSATDSTPIRGYLAGPNGIVNADTFAPPGWTIRALWSVNDDGQLLGMASVGGRFRHFRATPRFDTGPVSTATPQAGGTTFALNRTKVGGAGVPVSAFSLSPSLSVQTVRESRSTVRLVGRAQRIGWPETVEVQTLDGTVGATGTVRLVPATNDRFRVWPNRLRSGSRTTGTLRFDVGQTLKDSIRVRLRATDPRVSVPPVLQLPLGVKEAQFPVRVGSFGAGWAGNIVATATLPGGRQVVMTAPLWVRP